jgi:DNA-binding response OmpR family regulator
MRRSLVVDDDLPVGLAMRAPAQHGFRVAIADDGTSGLAARDNSMLELMIADVFMPNMRGFKSVRWFHQHAPSVPLVAICGRAFSNFEISGADFRKPHRKYGATLSAVTNAVSGPQRDANARVGKRAEASGR